MSTQRMNRCVGSLKTTVSGGLVIGCLVVSGGSAHGRQPVRPSPQTTTSASLHDGVTLTAVEEALVANTNEARARGGLAPLGVDPKLMRSARSHARRMAASRSLVHGGGVTENIGMGQSSASEAVSDWMQSPGHRGNILDAGHGALGVAVARAADGSLYWCQQFR